MFTTIIPDSKLQSLNNIIKLLKSDYIYITQTGVVYGFKDDFTVIREINININDIDTCIIRSLDFTNMIKAKAQSIIVKSGCKSELIPYGFGGKADANILYSGMYLKNTLDRIIASKNFIKETGHIIYTNPNFEQDPGFKEICSMPSSKGSMLLPNYGLYVYKGLVPFGAKDQVGLTLIQHGQQTLAMFEVFKPKGIKIDTYINYLNLY